jgi:hypothetical protein
MKSEHSEKDQKLLVNIPVKEREKTILLEGNLVIPRNAHGIWFLLMEVEAVDIALGIVMLQKYFSRNLT